MNTQDRPHRDVSVDAPASQVTTQATRFARFVTTLDSKAMPPDLLALAKGHLLDVLGIALASNTFDYGAAMLRAGRELSSEGPATLIGAGATASAEVAALVNGTFAHGLDFDDTHIASIYHASAPALAAALAVGEERGSSGRDVLTAFIASLEVGSRLAGVGAGEFHRRGLHPTAQCGGFASVAAAGYLRGADERALVNGFGLCGSQASGIIELGDSWLKRFHPGWAAHCGLIAEAMGRAGFRGPSTVFEGKHGFFAAHIGRAPVGEDDPTIGLGERWDSFGLALKPYPCCHFIHGFVDAALELHGSVDTSRIAAIECPLAEGLMPIVAEPRAAKIRPSTVYEALFSVPYVVALGLTKGRVDLAAFHDEPLDDPDILRLASITTCPVDPASDYPKRFPGEVVLHMTDGQVIRCRHPYSLGTPDKRMSDAQIAAKFIDNATRLISAEQAGRIVDLVLDLENLPDIRGLMALCA